LHRFLLDGIFSEKEKNPDKISETQCILEAGVTVSVDTTYDSDKNRASLTYPDGWVLKISPTVPDRSPRPSRIAGSLCIMLVRRGGRFLISGPKARFHFALVVRPWSGPRPSECRK